MTVQPSGVLGVYKPKDYTSFDCVAILRRQLGIKKIGHTGTLDPMAEGVLVCCFGRATRIIEYLEDDTKEYVGTLRLGVETDTCDIWGTVTAEKAVSIGEDLSEESVRQAFSKFRGTIDQVPPAYAAIKVNGKKLYDYARKGKPLDVPPRKVTIHSLAIESMAGSEVRFRVVCSRGTYIRALCRDIGHDLGCGGTMSALERTRVGAFRGQDCISIEKIKEMSAGEIEGAARPTDEALSELPALRLSKGEAVHLIHGQPLPCQPAHDHSPVGQSPQGQPLQGKHQSGLPDASETAAGSENVPGGAGKGLFRIYGGDIFVGVARLEGGALKADKILDTSLLDG